jgi:hypothetical protein
MLTATRRSFLALMGAGALAPRWALATRTTRCACGATFARPHAYRGPVRVGLHCPNCGRDIERAAFALDERGFGARGPAGAQCGGWDCAQVPFPNPRLVGSTDKAAVTLDSIRT